MKAIFFCVKCMQHNFAALGTVINFPSLKLRSFLKGISFQFFFIIFLHLGLQGIISTNEVLIDLCCLTKTIQF